MDRYEGDLKNVASLHKYVFTTNNPINNIDVLGKTTFPTTSCLVTRHYGEEPVLQVEADANPNLKMEGTKFHYGTDFYCPNGNVYATDSGTVVVKKGTTSTHENYIELKEDGTPYYQVYMHVSPLNIKVNEHIDEGSPIGYYDNSGQTTGPHVHYVRQTTALVGDRDAIVNPEPHFYSAQMPLNFIMNGQNTNVHEFIQQFSRGGLKATYISSVVTYSW
jgi:hypothetical protein